MENGNVIGFWLILIYPRTQFFRDNIILVPFKAIRVISLKSSRTLHKWVLRSWNWRTDGCRWARLFYRICALQTAQTSTQLTVRGEHAWSVFARQTATVLMNLNSGWFSSGAILTRTLSTWLLISGIKDFQHYVRAKGDRFKHTAW